MAVPSSTYHTIVVSDFHLADAEPSHKENPLWKKFRRKDYFIDQTFADFLRCMVNEVKGAPIELVFNGDTFDFDSITALPLHRDFDISYTEKLIGVDSTQEKSLFKIGLILRDHKVLIETLSEFVKEGNHVVFVIGNHDAELYWPQVQKAIHESLNLPENLKHHVRFCEWFYIAQGGTLIEHGHQYDPYCLILDPIYPLVKKKGEYKIRLPFGNLANRYMVNQMGLKNPHSDDSFMKSVPEFANFFIAYEMKTQPFMILTWFFGALRTLFTSINEGLYPTIKDPLTLEDRLKQIAFKANSEVSVVLALKENHAHPAVMRPLMVLRELWLDRAFLLIMIVWGCWQIFTTSNVFAHVSLWWFLVPLMASLPFFLYYAHGVKSDVRKNAGKALKRAPLSAKMANVKKVVHGHTHLEGHLFIEDIEYINTGTWSPRFRDAECELPYGEMHFAWINGEKNREMGLFIWKDAGIQNKETTTVTSYKDLYPSTPNPHREFVELT